MTRIYFQSPAERKEIKEMFLNVTQISQMTQIYFQSPAEMKEIKEMGLRLISAAW